MEMRGPSRLDDHHYGGSARVRPSMHSEFMGRKDSFPNGIGGVGGMSCGGAMAMASTTSFSGRQVRVRSLSNESDPGKARSSVPLLYASTISSMSTLSSSFYQYDSTGGNAGEPDGLATPSSSHASGDTTARSNRKQPQDAPLRLPPAQERSIRRDAARMTRELIVEQVQALDLLHNRSGSLRRHVAVGTQVAAAKGVRVFEKPGLGGGTSGRVKKHAVKRFTAHWQVHATMDEVLALLLRDDRDEDKYASCQSALHPDTVNRKLLWRAAAPRTTYNNRSVTVMDDDDDDDDEPAGVITVEMEREQKEHQLFSDQGGKSYANPYLHPPQPPSVASSVRSGKRRARRSTRPTDWMGINWWVQHMPNKLSRDRDLIVLEKQSEFETAGGGRQRRGFVHLRHSVDLADMSSVEKRLVSPFVRALVIQSGLVVVESDEPGVLDVSNSLEMDFAGHLTASQHRQLVLKRLLHTEPLGELLWKMRLLKLQRQPWKPQLDKSSDNHRGRCERCQFKTSRFSRRTLDSCKVCDRTVCSNCSSVWEFASALVAAAPPNKRLDAEPDRDGAIKARVCTHCVQEHSRPRINRNQSSVNWMPSDSYEYDEDEEGERGDVPGKTLPQYTITSQHLPRKQSRPSSAPLIRESEWKPTRSSRIAEDLVDDFLTSITGDSVLPDSIDMLSPSSSFSDEGEPELTPEPDFECESEPEMLKPPTAMGYPSCEAAMARKQRRDSRANELFAQVQAQEPPPRRKLSIFEAMPEPIPRKNVVLYEVSS